MRKLIVIDCDQLIQAYLDDYISPQDAASLELWIADNDVNAQYFVAAATVHSDIRDVLTDTQHRQADFADDSTLDHDTFSALLAMEQNAGVYGIVDITDEIKRQELEKQDSELCIQRVMFGETNPVQPVKHYVIPKAVFYGVIAALITMALMLFWPGKQPVVTPLPTAPQFVQVATLVEQVDAKWLAPGNAPMPGGALLNQRIHLVSGLAKLRFNNEAEVILEAPCSIEPVSDKELKITFGKLVGRCETDASKGFVVQTPGARIVDLGTEFGVSVDRAGVSDAQVFEGEIELAATALRSPVRLLKDQARRVDAAGLSVAAVDAHPFDFVRSEEFNANAKADESPYHRWLAHSYKLRRSAQPPIAMIDIDADELNQPRLFRNLMVDSKVTDAAIEDAWMIRDRFGRPRSAAYINDLPNSPSFRADGEFRELTLAAWVRLDAVDSAQKFRALLNSHGRRRRGQIYWMLFSNQRIRLTVRKDSEVYTEDGDHIESFDSTFVDDLIQGGRWRLLTVVCNLNQSYVRHYLDGQQIGQQKMEFAGSLVIGDCHLGDWEYQDRSDRTLKRDLYGGMDDLLIWDRTLTSEEIASLYEKSRPDN